MSNFLSFMSMEKYRSIHSNQSSNTTNPVLFCPPRHNMDFQNTGKGSSQNVPSGTTYSDDPVRMYLKEIGPILRCLKNSTLFDE